MEDLQDMFEPVSNKPCFSEMEKDILLYWDENNTFKKSLDARQGGKEFVFYDGPPFATGLPHYGHLLAGTIKDIIPRYKTMRGFYVDRRFGWDCHGLPVEYEVEQDLDISGKTEIEKLGVDVFNEKCRSIVLRYTSEWKKIVSAMGRWVDFDRDYKTMEPAYMESIWWVFKSLWDKNLIYEGKKILPFCPRCSTPLSNFETNQGYEEVTDPSITIRFAVKGKPDAYLLAWTTTPWTLPSNMALAVGSDITYLEVKEADATYYLAKDRFSAYYKEGEGYESVKEMKGESLAGMEYEPLFPYFGNLRSKGAFRVVCADFVSTEDGTGIVHIAPGFGEDDYRLGQAEGIPDVCPVDAEGKFTKDVPDYEGRGVKEADADIMRRLKEEKKLVQRGTIKHSYPHCWRCDTPLIYRAISTWFVKVEEMRDRIMEVNRIIHWVPGHLRDGRFGKWLEGARDWAISRNRYWGTPLPVWKSEDGSETVCVGSLEELQKLSGQQISDLHKHYVDDVIIRSPSSGKELKRIPEVLDCWFESGAMPYAQAHYPFEKTKHFEKHFPADFIAEGLDQTRGWFYTLMVLSVALFDKPAFQNVIVNGLVLAEDGRKMSKRLKNYPDPQYMIDTYGADALRLYMINSPVVKAEDLRFSEEGVKHLVRHIMLPWWNAYSFLVTYANIDKWTPEKASLSRGENVLDLWITSSLESLKESVINAMDDYDLQKAVRPFVLFVDNLTNWYIRRSRRRFWKSQDDGDKNHAYTTLYHVMLELSKIAAPFAPFISEMVYRNLRAQDMPESVHLCDFPEPDETVRDHDLEERMDQVAITVRLGRLLRSENNLKVRQPLSKLHVVSLNSHILENIKAFKDIVMDELNVKEVDFSGNEAEHVVFRAKADFRKLGPRFGSNVKRVASAISQMSSDEIHRLAMGEMIHMEADGISFDLDRDCVVIERSPREGVVVASEGEIVVVLETGLSRDLIDEGIAREFVNRVQNMRKTANLNIVDRIEIDCSACDAIMEAVERHDEYIMSETLCVKIVRVSGPIDGAAAWDINGSECHIRIRPAG